VNLCRFDIKFKLAFAENLVQVNLQKSQQNLEGNNVDFRTVTSNPSLSDMCLHVRAKSHSELPDKEPEDGILLCLAKINQLESDSDDKNLALLVFLEHLLPSQSSQLSCIPPCITGFRRGRLPFFSPSLHSLLYDK